jgi:hypothetical protein
VAVVVGRAAPELERYAASELCGYLEKLFAIQTQTTTNIRASAEELFLIGSPATNAAVKQATVRQPFPKVSDQGIVLRRTEFRKRPALIVGGGSPQATLWAVYELAERWGVRYLVHGDVLPEKSAEFRLPELNVTREPILRGRQAGTISDFAGGFESWGMTDFGPLLDQLAKLKLNRIGVGIYTYQPFLDYEVKGIKRRSAWLWYDYHYPITPDMVGRQLFGDAKEFWNPDLPLNASYEQFSAAGERLVHSLMGYAHKRGIECSIVASLTEFPPEFAPLLKGAQKIHQLGELTIVPGPETPVDDPGLTELASGVLRATVNTYPEADYVVIGMPEWRQWTGLYERAWQALDAKYGISKVLPLADVLAAAERRTGYPGGAKRAVDEVKGDLAALYFYDRLLSDLKVLNGTRRPDMKFIYGDVAEELFPILSRILPRGWETAAIVDYTPSRVLRRQEVLRTMPCREIPCNLVQTLDDDNIGVVPQLTTCSLYKLTQDLLRDGWAGFILRQRFIADHDPSMAYLARSAWDRDATPEAVERDQLRTVCGEGCVEDMLAAFHEVELATINLEWNNLGFTFPVPGMMMKNWKPGPMPADLVEDRSSYQRALEAARRALARATPAGRSYVDYWVGRLEFAVGYIDTVEEVRRAASAEAAKKPEETLPYAATALADARRALEAYARVARDPSDRGAIAVMNEYVYRPLKAKVAELGK